MVPELGWEKISTSRQMPKESRKGSKGLPRKERDRWCPQCWQEGPPKSPSQVVGLPHFSQDSGMGWKQYAIC